MPHAYAARIGCERPASYVRVADRLTESQDCCRTQSGGKGIQIVEVAQRKGGIVRKELSFLAVGNNVSEDLQGSGIIPYDEQVRIRSYMMHESGIVSEFMQVI